MTESSASQLVGIAVPTLRGLRSAVLATNDPDAAVTALREAGFVGGAAIYSAFEKWLSESGSTDISDAGDLPLEEFELETARFFRDAGWGEVKFSRADDDGVAIVDITRCWEGGSSGSGSGAGCHITTGLLAAFFGQIARYPIAVLETECCGGDESRCRFLMGNAEVMNYKWEEMQAV